jgi:AcrR family transcriptional regulator
MTEARRRTDTRSKIQEVALELFAEQGYEKTSLREIAERLGVTKAALYYHFRTKEDIIGSLFDDLLAQIDEIIEWGRGRIADDEVMELADREEIVRRYSTVLTGTGHALMQFVQGNQSAVRDLRDSRAVFERFRQLSSLLTDHTAPLVTQLKNNLALATLHLGYFAPFDLKASVDERHEAALQIAYEMLSGGS